MRSITLLFVSAASAASTRKSSARNIPAAPLSSRDADEYIRYSRFLSEKADEVDKEFGGSFGRFMTTLKDWAPTIAGVTAGTVVGGLPIISWIIGPYAGAVLGSGAGMAYGASSKLANKAQRMLSNETTKEFRLASSGIANLTNAEADANQTEWSSSFHDSEDYFTYADNSTAEYASALRTTYAPASSNLRNFWKTKERVLTVLAGGRTMADYFKLLTEGAKKIGKEAIPAIFHNQIDKFLENVERCILGPNVMREELIHARDYLAVLDRRDSLIGKSMWTRRNLMIGGAALTAGALLMSRGRGKRRAKIASHVEVQVPEEVPEEEPRQVKRMKPVKQWRDDVEEGDSSDYFVLYASIGILAFAVVLLITNRRS